jgi:hypothetical protein
MIIRCEITAWQGIKGVYFLFDGIISKNGRLIWKNYELKGEAIVIFLKPIWNSLSGSKDNCSFISIERAVAFDSEKTPGYSKIPC